MYQQLFETIRLQDGQLHLLEYHTQRLNESRKKLGFDGSIDLAKEISVPAHYKNGLYRCRVSYEQHINKIEFFKYQLRHPTEVQLIEANLLDYHLKYEDRTEFEHLMSSTSADEIIVIQNGFLTDTSFSNIAFWEGRHWITPTHFLLNGVKRRFLLEKGILIQQPVSLEAVMGFSKIAFINAMRDFEVVYSYQFDKFESRLRLFLEKQFE